MPPRRVFHKGHASLVKTLLQKLVGAASGDSVAFHVFCCAVVSDHGSTHLSNDNCSIYFALLRRAKGISVREIAVCFDPFQVDFVQNSLLPD